ncbi:MAG TPA: hypothetical protein PKI62_04855 [bacterium]|nr:hypothetical protein [bacterium]
MRHLLARRHTIANHRGMIALSAGIMLQALAGGEPAGAQAFVKAGKFLFPINGRWRGRAIALTSIMISS